MTDKSKSPGKEINQQSSSTNHPVIVLKLGGPPSASTSEKREQSQAADVAVSASPSVKDSSASGTTAAHGDAAAKQPGRDENEEPRTDQSDLQSYAGQSEEEPVDARGGAPMDNASKPASTGQSSPQQQDTAMGSPPPAAPQASLMPSVITLVAASNVAARPASVGGTPRLPPAAQTQSQQQGQPQQPGMQLTDAFAYLDRVRSEFADQPEVYNRFLQVMREFKANSIDANGVIARVVHLFKGHRALILGFNAFLPKTHHIDPNLTDFTHLMYPRPSGAPSSASRPPSYAAPPPNLPSPSPGWMADMQQQSQQPGMPRLAPNPQPPTLQHLSSFHQQYHHYYPQSANAPPGPPPSHLLPRPPASSPSHRGPQLPPGMAFPPPPSAQPAFPNIAPPSTGAHHPPGFPLMSPVSASGGAAVAATTAAGIIYTGTASASGNFSHLPSPAPMPASAAPRRQQSSAAGAAPSQSTAATGNAQPNTQFSRAVAFVKKIKHRYASDPETYRTFLNCLHAFHRDQRSVPDVCRQVGGLFREAPDLMDEFLQFLPSSTASSSDAGAADLVGAASTSLRSRKRTRPSEAMAIARTQEETAFFERVRHHLGSRAVYAEFLKCLALYSQDILRLRDLLQLIDGFIGGAPELLAWFRRYLGVETAGQRAASPERMPTVAASGGGGELNLSTCKRVGSYRLLPTAYRMVPASGRTPLCAEVLNDTMVSTASFESEDAGFVSSKKNVYEEALFRCEDERFEMDLLIEHNMATIAVLEPIARKLAVMEEQQRASLRLDASLGGSSRTIYRRAIRRVYGPERGDDIYRALQERSSTAIPIVLARLRQKDAEWRRVQRDWARVWRDVHARNYHRSLDHHGIDFKTADRRTFSIRAFVAEIEQLRSTTRRRSVSGSSASVLPQLPSPVATLRLAATDSACLRDVQELLLVAVRSSPAPYSGHDRRHLAHLFATLPSDLFGLPPIPESADGQNDDTASGENDDDRRATRRTLQPVIDLSPKATAAAALASATTTATPAANPQVLYGNNVVYALVRILHLAADRLTRMCAAAAAANGQAHFAEKASVVAGFLGLNNAAPSSADKGGGTAAAVSDFYGVLKELLAKLLSATAQGDEFEEQARFMFGTAAYPVYTFDRLAAAAIRQAQACLADPAALLIQQYTAWRSKQGSSEYSYRLAAESIVAPRDNLYRIECYRDGSLAVQLLDRLASTGAAATGSMEGGSPSMTTMPVTLIEERWSAYVDDFVRMDPIGRYIRCLPFLRRCVQSVRCPLIDYRLECKICVNTYRLFFLEHTEDFLLKPRPAATRPAGGKRTRRFAEWLDARPS